MSNDTISHTPVQIYLENFIINKKEKAVWVYQKDGISNPEKRFIKDISFEREEETDKNLTELGPHFQRIESDYERSIQSFEQKRYSNEAKKNIADNIARIGLWTPTRKRLLKDRSILIPFIHSDGALINSLSWTILRIDHSSTSQFITSDNPISVLKDKSTPHSNIINTYMPLTSQIAIFIHCVGSMPLHTLKERIIGKEEVDRLNVYTANFADNFVISCIQDEGIRKLTLKSFFQEQHSKRYIR